MNRELKPTTDAAADSERPAQTEACASNIQRVKYKFGPRIASFVASDGYRGYVRIWNVEKPLGRVVLLHGIISHGGWYLSSCEHLARAGFEIHFLERRGSGLNIGGRGDVDHWTTWRSDVEDYLTSLGSAVPRLLLGISWGGKLASAVALHRPQLLAGVGLLCPGLYANRGPGPMQRALLRVAAATWLRERRVTIPLQDSALFTANVDWQRFIDTDPLALRTISLRFAAEDQKLNQLLYASARQISVPFLLMLAGRDRISHNGRLQDFFNNLVAKDKYLVTYPNAGHTLEFEPDTMSYCADLSEWLISCANADG